MNDVKINADIGVTESPVKSDAEFPVVRELLECELTMVGGGQGDIVPL